MPSVKIFQDSFDFIRARICMILWISLVLYLFYDTFVFYKDGRQFYYTRRILGLGLCVSRGTASVLNLCGAFILLPQCKKLNQIFYRIVSKLWPGLFFFWLEKTKSFHMTVATTLVLFGVLHSVSHFVNLWNFSRGFDEECREINFANYKNENPFHLLLSMTCITGFVMFLTMLLMGMTSLRVVRRRLYNAFWYAHQLYLPFMVLFLIHPLSGVLKQEIINENSLNPSHIENTTYVEVPRFTAIESQTWLWMSVPLTCFFVDLLWRIFSRNRAVVDILEACNMPGRTISLKLSCPNKNSVYRSGQYVVLQCPQISLLEWHPFTVVKVPTSHLRSFVVWIRVKGDWTEALEKLLKERGPRNINLLVDGAFSSPMEGVSRDEVAICVAAGVGITPFVAVLDQLYQNPRSRLPGRIHLIWVVRHEEELTWLAELANKTIVQLRAANRPDRLHIQFYVTNNTSKEHVVVINEKGKFTHVLNKIDDEKATLLTPYCNRKKNNQVLNKISGEKETLLTPLCNRKKDVNKGYSIAKDFPLLGCRVRRGRPHWDRVFGYWVHLYPEYSLNLFCCGPKKLVKLLREKCEKTTRNTKTKISFIHEGFS